MTLASDVDDDLRAFLAESAFLTAGAIVTDLDGTAVHEFEGRIAIPDPVSHGLKHLNDLGRPVVLNTLRFPLNVIRTFGREWYSITNAPLPLVSLNGGIAGYLREDTAGEIVFEEMAAFPVGPAEVEGVMAHVEELVAGGIEDVLVFHYGRDYLAGETIWTPVPAKVPHVQAKYVSASAVVSSELEALRATLLGQDICMIFLLVEAPQDRLMAYQHIRPSSFVTRPGVDKLSGARAVADLLGFDLAASVGCGDTPMDAFLAGCGLAVHVGPLELEHQGILRTVRIRNSLDLGEMLFRLSQLEVRSRA